MIVKETRMEQFWYTKQYDFDAGNRIARKQLDILRGLAKKIQDKLSISGHNGSFFRKCYSYWGAATGIGMGGMPAIGTACFFGLGGPVWTGSAWVLSLMRERWMWGNTPPE